MDKRLLKEVNDYLLREFGEVGGDPRFRVVWSTGLTEKRFGTFEDYYGKILVRSVKEVREVLKYPDDQDRWILEQLLPVRNPELLTNWSFEPLYVFRDKRGLYLPLNMKAVQMIADYLKKPYDWSRRRTELEEEDRLQQEKEVNEFLDFFDDEGRTPLFADDMSVFVSDTLRKVK